MGEETGFDDLQRAILLLLGGLPQGCEVRLYWEDGVRQLLFIRPDATPEHYALAAAADAD